MGAISTGQCEAADDGARTINAPWKRASSRGCWEIEFDVFPVCVDVPVTHSVRCVEASNNISAIVNAPRDRQHRARKIERSKRFFAVDDEGVNAILLICVPSDDLTVNVYGLAMVAFAWGPSIDSIVGACPLGDCAVFWYTSPTVAITVAATRQTTRGMLIFLPPIEPLDGELYRRGGGKARR